MNLVIPASMQALQLQGVNKLVQVELPVPVPHNNEVLIRTEAATICTSDLIDIRSNPFGIRYPRVMGHEGSGVIIGCGSDVHDFKTGDRVSAHPVVPCGTCDECVRGFDHICSRMGHLGIDRDGCFAEFFVQRADRVRVLPEEVSFLEGALMEPVAVCLQALARAGDLSGRTVLVVGDGPFGNIIARLARHKGAARVLVSGRTPFRLQMIPGVEIAESDPVRSVDIAILAVSSSDAVETCVKALRPRGRLIIFSSVEKPLPIDLFHLHILELEVVGACNDEDRMDEALRCISDRELALSELITHQLPLRDWNEAFSLARDCHDEALKVAIRFTD